MKCEIEFVINVQYLRESVNVYSRSIKFLMSGWLFVVYIGLQGISCFLLSLSNICFFLAVWDVFIVCGGLQSAVLSNGRFSKMELQDWRFFLFLPRIIIQSIFLSNIAGKSFSNLPNDQKMVVYSSAAMKRRRDLVSIRKQDHSLKRIVIKMQMR